MAPPETPAPPPAANLWPGAVLQQRAMPGRPRPAGRRGGIHRPRGLCPRAGAQLRPPQRCRAAPRRHRAATSILLVARRQAIGLRAMGPRASRAAHHARLGGLRSAAAAAVSRSQSVYPLYPLSMAPRNPSGLPPVASAALRLTRRPQKGTTTRASPKPHRRVFLTRPPPSQLPPPLRPGQRLARLSVCACEYVALRPANRAPRPKTTRNTRAAHRRQQISRAM